MLTRKLTIAAIAAILCSGISTSSFAQGMGMGMGGGEPEREIVNVTGDLYRFRQVRHIGVFLVTDEGIILVDPTFPEMAAWVKEQLDERFGVPVRYVIYSHSHNDHAGGGDVFADTATFLGHENMVANLQRPADDAPLLPREQLRDINGDGLLQDGEAFGVSSNNFARWDADGNGGLNRAEIWSSRFGGPTVRPPDIVYSDHASVTLGGKTVELIYTGRNHTDDMTVVYFPEERAIYTVDFLTPNRPARTELEGGYLPEWAESLRRVEQIDFDIAVPGHESPGTKAQISEQARYMEDLYEAVSSGIAAGMTEDELAATVLMEDYSHLIEYEFSRERNVRGAYEILMSTPGEH